MRLFVAGCVSALLLGACGGHATQQAEGKHAKQQAAASSSGSPSTAPSTAARRGGTSHGSSSSASPTTTAGGGAASASADEAKAVGPLARLLLVSSDLGDGWQGSGTRNGGPSSNTLYDICGKQVAIPSADTPVTTLTDAATSDVVTHLVRRYDAPADATNAVQAIGRAGSECKDWTFTTNGKRTHVQIGDIGYGIVGDGRTAFRLTVQHPDGTLNADYYVWHRGAYVEAVMHITSATLDPDVTKKAINVADQRLIDNG